MNQFFEYFLHVFEKIEDDFLKLVEVGEFSKDITLVKIGFQKISDYVNSEFQSVEHGVKIDLSKFYDELSKLIKEFEDYLHKFVTNQVFMDLGMVISEIIGLIYLLKTICLPILKLNKK